MTAAALSAARRTALLDARTAALARRGAADARDAAIRPFLVCACGPDRYGLPLATVARVIPARPCASVPGAPAALVGLIAVAGRLVSVLDLSAALGAAAFADATAGHFVILRGGEAAIALAVDRVLGVVSARAGREDGAGSPGFGAAAVSVYATQGMGQGGSHDDGLADFVVIDPPSLSRRFLS